MADEGDPDAKPRTLVSGLENSVVGRREPGEEAGPGRVLGVSRSLEGPGLGRKLCCTGCPKPVEPVKG